jgi:hypothetical protein
MSRHAGSSLVELMIGMTLMVIGLLATTSLGVQAARMRQIDEQLAAAAAACRTNLEELRGMPIAMLPGLDGTGFDVPAADGSPLGLRAVDGDSDGLTGEIHVTVEQSNAVATLYRVLLRVRWIGPVGAEDFELTTLVGDRRP